MGDKNQNSHRAYVVRLELTDRPGELLSVLEPIASNGGNLLSIFHERGDTSPSGNIPVEIDLMCSSEQFESILSSYLDLDIKVTQSGEEKYKQELIILLIGESIVTDLSEIISSVNSEDSLSVVDSSTTLSGESPSEASTILRLAIKENDRLKAIDLVKSVLSDYGLYIIINNEQGVGQ